MRTAGNRAGSVGQDLPQQVAELAAELTEAADEQRRHRLARQVTGLASRTGQAARRSVAAGRTATRRGAQAGGSATLGGLRALRVSGQWLTAQVLQTAPRVPVRSYVTLRQQYPDLAAGQLADRLIATAARASAGVGAAVGVAAAVPFIPAAPAELGVETLALVAIELKLIAELHEAYEMPAPGSAAQRMLAYTGAWAEQRGVRITGSGLALAVGSPLRRKLERRLAAKAGGSALALAPLLTGAVAGALLGHHETRSLGIAVRDDLRKRALAAAGGGAARASSEPGQFRG